MVGLWVLGALARADDDDEEEDDDKFDFAEFFDDEGNFRKELAEKYKDVDLTPPPLPSMPRYAVTEDTYDAFIMSKPLVLVFVYDDEEDGRFKTMYENLHLSWTGVTGNVKVAGVTLPHNISLTFGDISSVEHPGVLNRTTRSPPVALLYRRGRLVNEFTRHSSKMFHMIEQIIQADNITFWDMYPKTFNQWKKELDYQYFSLSQHDQVAVRTIVGALGGGCVVLVVLAIRLLCYLLQAICCKRWSAKNGQEKVEEKVEEKVKEKVDYEEETKAVKTKGDAAKPALRRRMVDSKEER